MKPPPRAVAAVLSVVLLVPAVDLVQQRQSGDLSPQSRINAHFAGRSSLSSALRLYPRYWPPLYPTILWLAARAGLVAQRVNQVFFVLTLMLLALYAALHLRTHWTLPLLLFAAGHYNYVNIHQYISETLFTFVSLALLLLLLRYRLSGRGLDLLGLTLAGAALAATKYIALFWALPLTALHVLLDPPAPLRRRAWHAAVFLAASVAPVGVWMGLAYSESGYLTGSDRFAPRQFEELTTLDRNLAFTAKTLLVDFTSLQKYASHAVINAPYQPSPWESTLAVIALLAVAAVFLARRRRDAASEAWPPAARLVAEFFVTYLVALIVLWTAGNNDPIYTRFLYPSYPFLVLLGFHAYDAVKALSGSPWLRLPFRILYPLLLVTHSVRDYHAVALPLR